MPDEPISGAISSTYTLIGDDVGREIYCRVTATNAYGAAGANSNIVGPIISGGPVEGTAFTLIASTQAFSPDGSAFNTPTIDTTGADLIVLSISSYGGVGAPGIFDSKGNTWNGGTEISSAISRVRLYFTKPVSVGSGHYFGIAVGTSYGSLHVAAFSGSHAIPQDGNTGASGTSASPSAGSITPSADEALIVTAICNAGSTIASSISDSFHVLTPIAHGSGNMGGALAYFNQSVAAAINPTWTLAASADWVATVSAFKSV